MATNNKGTYRKTTYWDGCKSHCISDQLGKGADDDPAFEVFSDSGHVVYDFAGETSTGASARDVDGKFVVTSGISGSSICTKAVSHTIGVASMSKISARMVNTRLEGIKLLGCLKPISLILREASVVPEGTELGGSSASASVLVNNLFCRSICFSTN